jgi:hypothetical protein
MIWLYPLLKKQMIQNQRCPHRRVKLSSRLGASGLLIQVIDCVVADFPEASLRVYIFHPPVLLVSVSIYLLAKKQRRLSPLSYTVCGSFTSDIGLFLSSFSSSSSLESHSHAITVIVLRDASTLMSPGKYSSFALPTKQNPEPIIA